jgi:hypothetical protein
VRLTDAHSLVCRGDSKPKLDLFRTCVAAVPRLLPDGMSPVDVIDLLARMTVHMDEELRGMACQTLQNLMGECADWREDIVHGYLTFLTRDVQDTYPSLLDNALRLLLQLISTWKQAVILQARKVEDAIIAECATNYPLSRIHRRQCPTPVRPTVSRFRPCWAME